MRSCFHRPKESFISQTINAFDFAEARSKKDRDLLYEAKYGERGPDVSCAHGFELLLVELCGFAT